MCKYNLLYSIEFFFHVFYVSNPYFSPRRKTEINTNEAKDGPIVMSTSQENMTREDREREAMYRQYIGQNYTQTPIKDEGIFGFEPDGSFR